MNPTEALDMCEHFVHQLTGYTVLLTLWKAHKQLYLMQKLTYTLS